MTKPIRADGIMQLRRYPNRRIYSADERRYITLREIRRSLESGASSGIVCICHKTGLDMTREFLWALLHERELEKPQLTSAQLLSLLKAR